MLNKKRLVLTISLCLVVFISSFAQSAGLKQVEDLYKKKRFSQAITILHKQIKSNKNDVAAHRYLVRCYNKLRKLGEITAKYNTFVVKEPDNAVYRFIVGYIYDLKGQTIGALRAYEEALSLDPKLPFVNYNLGWIYDDQGEIKTAIEHYEKEIKINPSNLDAYHNLAKDYRRKKRYDKVISTAKKMLTVDSEDIRGHDSLGWAYYDQGQVEEALKEWKKTVKLSSHDREAGKHNVAGYILDAKGMYNSAMREFLKGIRKNPNNARLHNNLGQAYVHKVTAKTFGNKNNKWPRKAMKEFKKAIEINPKYAEAYLSLGNVYFKMGMNNDGIKQYETFVKLKPNDISGLNILGNAFKEMGNYEEAKEAFNKVIDKFPKDYNAYANLGAVYYKQGLQDAALAQWKKSLQLNPYQPLLRDRLETAFKKH